MNSVFIQSCTDDYNDLTHHGIKGQSWGDRNGPPYPLDAETHKAVVNGDNYVKQRIKDAKKEDLGVIGGGALFATAGAAGTAITMSMGFISPRLVASIPVGLGVSVVGTVNLVKDSSRGKKITERRNSEKIDSKTGLHIKNQELELKDDIKEVNPLSTGEKTNINCQSCSVAFEMRRRGYDCMAKEYDSKNKTSSPSKLYDLFGVKEKDINRVSCLDDDYDYKDCKKEAKDKRTVVSATEQRRMMNQNSNLNNNEINTLYNGLTSTLSKQKNSHGEMGLQWSGGFGSGHSMQYSVDKAGNVTFTCAQTNKVYTEKEFKNQILYRSTGVVNTVRLDDKKVNNKELNKWVA